MPADNQGTGPPETKGSLWSPKGLVAVLDTSTLVATYLSKAPQPAPSRRIVQAAGVSYDSFTSPPIIEEVEGVLAESRFNFVRSEVRRWLDTFLRFSRQVNAFSVPGDFSGALGDDEKDNPVLLTALAVSLHEKGQRAVVEAKSRYGCFIVSWDKHFDRGRNVWGWEFIRPDALWARLRSVG